MKQLVTSVCALLLLSGVAVAQNVKTTSAKGEQPLTFVENNLAGGGVYIFNVKFNNSAGAIKSDNIGKFNANGFEELGMESGVIITTGDIKVAEGPNNQNGVAIPSSPKYTCPILNEYMQPYNATDCGVLEFDFVCLSNHVSFNYTFGSEEYQSFTCSQYNDVFAFFLTGMDPETGDETTRNIASIPGTVSEEYPDGLAVGVNTVNSGTSSGNSDDGCISLDYSMYFVNNYFDISTNTSPYPGIQYEGFTNKLKAEADIVPCEVYHMYITVCNCSDENYDSGVLIEGNSFEAPTAQIGLSRPDVGTIMGSCPFDIPLSLAGTGFNEGTIVISTKGTAKMGTDYVLVDEEGNTVTDLFSIDEKERKLTIKVFPSTDLSTDKTIELDLATSLCSNYPQLVVYDTQHFVIKKGDDVQLADTTINATKACFKVGARLLYGTDPITYRWEPTTGIDNPYARESSANITESRNYKLYATGGTSCNTAVADVKVNITGGTPDDYKVGIDDVLENGARINVQESRIVVSGQGLGGVEMFDVDGRQVASVKGAEPITISTTGMASGIYTLRISTAMGVSTAKVVVNK